jgi:hypothetical protein
MEISLLAKIYEKVLKKHIPRKWKMQVLLRRYEMPQNDE